MSTSEPQVIDATELRDSAQALLAAADAEGVGPEVLWQRMVEAGWLALGVSADMGGLGQPIASVAALLEEVGRRPRAHPLPAATVATLVLDRVARGGCPRARQLLDDALEGRALVVCCELDARMLGLADGKELHDLGPVPHAAVATHLLAVVSCPDRGQVLVVLPRGDGAGECRMDPHEAWDPTRQYGRVTVRGPLAEAAVLRTGSTPATEILERTRAALDLSIASDSLGAAAQLLDTTVAYMQQRIQFGRPIASFQALKHRCADLATELAAARAALARACADYDASAADWRLRAALARAGAGITFCAVAEESIQLHGGIGFTWEHTCHRYLKRARSAEVIGGSRAERLDAIAERLVLEIRSDG